MYADDARTTYQQAINSDDAKEKGKGYERWIQRSFGKRFMEAGHEDEGSPTNRMQMGVC